MCLGCGLDRKELHPRTALLLCARGLVVVEIIYNIGGKLARSIRGQSVERIHEFLTGLMRASKGLDEDGCGLYDPLALVGRRQRGKYVTLGLRPLSNYQV